jgi:hypothetical protein
MFAMVDESEAGMVVRELDELFSQCLASLAEGSDMIDWGGLHDQMFYNPTWVYGLDDGDQVDLVKIIDDADCGVPDLFDWICRVFPTYRGRLVA